MPSPSVNTPPTSPEDSTRFEEEGSNRLYLEGYDWSMNDDSDNASLAREGIRKEFPLFRPRRSRRIHLFIVIQGIPCLIQTVRGEPLFPRI